MNAHRHISVRLIGTVLSSLVLSFGCGTEATPLDGDAGVDTGDPCSVVECEAGFSCFNGECVATSTCVDGDGDGYGDGCDLGDDCDDTRGDVNPARAEICDTIDNNCDFYVDEDNVCAPCNPQCAPGERSCSGPAVILCDDSGSCPRYSAPQPCGANQGCRDGQCYDLCTDGDRDGSPVDCTGLNDCDDTRDDVYPGNVEVCDGIDNNCDRRVDENNVCDAECIDQCAAGARECSADGAGRVACELGPDNCLRWSGTISCGASRYCVDGACTDRPVCNDPDGDGAGPGCTVASDCRGADPAAYPGATETCNGLDDDCDGVPDDGGVCATCTAATLAAPARLAVGGALYRQACGGAEYVQVSGTTGGTTAIIALGVSALDLGTGSSAFAAVHASFGLGPARAIVVDGSAATTLRYSAAAGVPVAIAAQSVASGCVPDRLEPNNSPGGATPVGSGPFVAAATVCAGDFDFYEVTVRPGEILEAAVAYDPNDAQLSASVWRNAVEVAPSFGSSESRNGLPVGRRMHFRTDEPGRYVIGVRGLSAAAAAPYAIAIAARPAPACTDDGREVRADGTHDDTVGTAIAAGPGVTINGTLCPGDFDMFSLGRLSAGQLVTGAFTPANPNIQILLLQGGWISPRDFPSNIAYDDTYYLAIFGNSASATGTWSVNWSAR